MKSLTNPKISSRPKSVFDHLIWTKFETVNSQSASNKRNPKSWHHWNRKFLLNVFYVNLCKHYAYGSIEILGHKTSRRNSEWYHFLSVPILANFLLLDQLLGGHGGRTAGGQRSQMFRVFGRARTVPKAPLWHPAQTVHGQGRLSDPYRLPLCL